MVSRPTKGPQQIARWFQWELSGGHGTLGGVFLGAFGKTPKVRFALEYKVCSYIFGQPLKTPLCPFKPLFSQLS